MFRRDISSNPKRKTNRQKSLQMDLHRNSSENTDPGPERELRDPSSNAGTSKDRN